LLISVSGLMIVNHSLRAADWSQWRGPLRDGKSAETGLLQDWSQSAPKLLWQAEGMGSGYASVAVAEGRIFTLGHRKDDECLLAVSVKDGSLLWALPFGTGDHSNGTPTVDGQYVYAIGLKGDLVCAAVETGEKIWSKNFARDFDGKMMSGWGYSESPLIDGDRLICTPGGNSAVVVALDKLTGDEVWRAQMPEFGARGQSGAGYASIVTSHGANVKQYIQLTGRGLIGVRASDGKVLWGYNAIANDTANIPTPIVSGEYVFCSTGYGTGAALLRLIPDGDGVRAEEVYFLAADAFQNHHGGLIQVGDYIYAGHKHNQGFPICLEMMTGKPAWGGDKRGPGNGSAAITYADGNLVFRYQDGRLALIEATSDEYRLKGTFMPAYQQGESWSHPVIANGKLYLREQDKLMCYDVTARD
jgi:outer membrane protein assembly factor BamB